MHVEDLGAIEDAFRLHWGPHTCDPVDLPDWHSGNPSRGQCGVTALILQEILGGELLIADVLFTNGATQGVHYWNLLPNGAEVDLTRGQFADTEIVQKPEIVPRQRRTPGRLAEQYEHLRSAVLEELGLNESDLTLIEF